MERVRPIADAVMLEGYMLYPYRKSSAKNQYRWTFGVVAPKPWSEANGSEPWSRSCECLVTGTRPRVRARLRFLDVRGDEGTLREIDFRGDRSFSASDIDGLLELRVSDGRVSVGVRNMTLVDPSLSRSDVLPSSLVAAQIVLAVEDGTFLSSVDCRADGLHPVLIDDELVLCSPIILEDRPRIAPESPGDFFDSGEIDELLALRTLTLTPEEKLEARKDPRTAALIDRVEAMTQEQIASLHGAVRSYEKLSLGSRVRLKPGKRRTDAQDVLYAGRIATVEALREDVDGRRMVAVTIDDDPAADMHKWYGRFQYYYFDEVEPI